MTPFDRPYTVFYWSAIVNIALSGTVFELFDRSWYHEKSLKVIQTSTIRKLGCGFLFAFYSNYGFILHHLRDKARMILVENRGFFMSGSPTILVFPYQTGWQYCDGDPLTGTPNARGYEKKITICDTCREWRWVTSNSDFKVTILFNVK